VKSHWFLPQTPDVLGLLRSQAQVTIAGMDAFVAWSAGDAVQAQAVADAEHGADKIRQQLQTQLRIAFSTPLDAEDIYELSERLDAVINGAKNAVREAALIDVAPDEAAAKMAVELAGGVRHIDNAFAALIVDADVASSEANAAIKCERNIEHLYRSAMSDLLDVNDLRHVMALREMYRRYARLGEALVRVAERVWYAVVKHG